MSSKVKVYELCALREPYMVMGISGWPNAGEVSVMCSRYLMEKLSAKKFAELEGKWFYDMSLSRPFVSIEDGLLKGYAAPYNEFYYAVDGKHGRDLVFSIGNEPNLDWEGYVDLVLGLARDAGVVKIFIFGGVLDQLSHNAAPVISGVVNRPELLPDLRRHGIVPSNYSGPSSIHGLILEEARKRNIPAMSLWGHVPSYFPGPNPKVSYALLTKFVEITGIEVDLEDMRRRGEAFEESVKEFLERSESLGDFLKSLGTQPPHRRDTPEYVT
jgi:proteasome assembly chaperone (PAC2) family protein